MKWQHRNRNKPKVQRLDEDDEQYEAQAVEEKEVCPSGKVILQTKSQAAHAAKQLRKFQKDPFLHDYHCDLCGHYHVGHQIGSRRQQADLLKAAS
jgi:hypothetical protein